MSIAPPLVVPGDSSIDVPLESLKRFTVEEYHALIEAGFFADDEGFELLEGLLVHKMGKNRPHSLATRRLREFLAPLLRTCYVDSQEPVTTGESEPEPDVSIVRGKAEDYPSHQPLAENVVLVVEVSEGTLRRDRGLKKRIYARAAIPVYWIVNLIDRRIEVYTRPTGPIESPDYRDCEVVAEDGQLPVVIDGSEVGRLVVKDLLP